MNKERTVVCSIVIPMQREEKLLMQVIIYIQNPAYCM